jgi:hypothetical protein
MMRHAWRKIRQMFCRHDWEQSKLVGLYLGAGPSWHCRRCGKHVFKDW